MHTSSLCLRNCHSWPSPERLFPCVVETSAVESLTSLSFLSRQTKIVLAFILKSIP